MHRLEHLLAFPPLETITDFFGSKGIPISELRGFGSDNAANMSGGTRGAQRYLRDQNPSVVFSPCAPHTLNLTGVHAAEICADVKNFFGNVDRLYAFFAVSPYRWDILLQCTNGRSLHSSSDTRWCARLDAIRPLAQHLPGVLTAVRRILDEGRLSSTGTAHAEVSGLLDYFTSFEAILMLAFWEDILRMFNERSVVLQSAKLTLNKVVALVDSLVRELQEYRSDFTAVFDKAKGCAQEAAVDPVLREKRRRYIPHRFSSTGLETEPALPPDDTPQSQFTREIFFATLDFMVEDLKRRSSVTKDICEIFAPVLNGITSDSDEHALRQQSTALLSQYCNDLDDTIVAEILHFRKVASDIFDNGVPEDILELLNGVYKLQLQTVFPQLCIALRLFCSIPTSICSSERSFSKLKRIKTVARTRTSQDRLSGLSLLSIEHDLATSVDFSNVIRQFSRDTVRRFPRFN